jgi:two-component system sensor histidine kinase/response regulator
MLTSNTPWSTLRILVAEDNLVNQKVLNRMLERLEVESVTIVGNGEEAVKREAEEQFDLVLMDMQMPVMDGIEACKAIHKRQQGHPIAKVVFVTAHVVYSFQQTCLDNGAIGCIGKPCNKKDVEDALQQALLWKSYYQGLPQYSDALLDTCMSFD